MSLYSKLLYLFLRRRVLQERVFFSEGRDERMRRVIDELNARELYSWRVKLVLAAAVALLVTVVLYCR